MQSELQISKSFCMCDAHGSLHPIDNYPRPPFLFDVGAGLHLFFELKLQAFSVPLLSEYRMEAISTGDWSAGR